jgi:hypothetical protein
LSDPKASNITWFSMLLAGALVLIVSLGSYMAAFGADGYAQRLAHPYWQAEQSGGPNE